MLQTAGLALSVARFSFDNAVDERASLDAARLMTRLIRNIDFATRDEQGGILVLLLKPICAAPT